MAIKYIDQQQINVNSSGHLSTVVETLPATPAGTNAIGKLLPSDVDVTTNTNHAQKYYTSAGAATDGIIWSPAAGKRWHIVSLYINISAAATITLEDDLTAGDSAVWKGELAANSGVVIYFGEEHPLASGEDVPGVATIKQAYVEYPYECANDTDGISLDQQTFLVVRVITSGKTIVAGNIVIQKQRSFYE